MQQNFRKLNTTLASQVGLMGLPNSMLPDVIFTIAPIQYACYNATDKKEKEIPAMRYNAETIASFIDAAVLAPQLSFDEARAQTLQAIEAKCKTVCVRPCSLDMTTELCRGTETKVSVVLGFPHGDQTTETKVAEARDTMRRRPFEVDMVGNIGLVRSGAMEVYESEVRAVAEAVHDGGARLKVILEISQLTSEQIAEATRACIRAGADFVKTSTGFTGGGATIEAVQTMLAAADGKIEVKASGGIRSYEEAVGFIEMGCTRLGVGVGSLKAILSGGGLAGEGY